MNRIEIPEDSAIVMLTCRTTPAFGNERRRCDKSQPHRVTEDVVAGFVMEAFNKLLPFASGEQRVEKNKAVEIARLITDGEWWNKNENECKLIKNFNLLTLLLFVLAQL